MGYLTAREVRAQLPEDQALAWHLQYNLCPPMSLIFLPVIREALAAARIGDFHRRLQLTTERVATVADVIKRAQLQPFLDRVEEA